MAESSIVNTMLAAAQVFMQQQQLAQQQAYQMETLKQREADLEERAQLHELNQKLADRALDQKALALEETKRKNDMVNEHNKAMEEVAQQKADLTEKRDIAAIDAKAKYSEAMQAQAAAKVRGAEASAKTAAIRAQAEADKALRALTGAEEKVRQFDLRYALDERKVTAMEQGTAARVSESGARTSSLQAKTLDEKANRAAQDVPFPDDLNSFQGWPTKKLEDSASDMLKKVNANLDYQTLALIKSGDIEDPRVGAQTALDKITKALTFRRQTAEVFKKNMPTSDEKAQANTVFPGTASAFDANNDSMQALQLTVGGLNDGSLPAFFSGASQEEKVIWSQENAQHLANLRSTNYKAYTDAANQINAALSQNAPDMLDSLIADFTALTQRK